MLRLTFFYRLRAGDDREISFLAWAIAAGRVYRAQVCSLLQSAVEFAESVRAETPRSDNLFGQNPSLII